MWFDAPVGTGQRRGPNDAQGMAGIVGWLNNWRMNEWRELGARVPAKGLFFYGDGVDKRPGKNYNDACPLPLDKPFGPWFAEERHRVTQS